MLAAQAAAKEASAPAVEEPAQEQPKVAAVVPVQAQPQLAAKKEASAKEIAITAHAERPRKSQVIPAAKADMPHIDAAAAAASVSALPGAPAATPAPAGLSVSPLCPASVPACLTPQLGIHATLRRAGPCWVRPLAGTQQGPARTLAVDLLTCRLCYPCNFLLLMQTLQTANGHHCQC